VHCNGCGSERVTELRMTLTDGSPVNFVSCHDCECRRWSQGASSLSFERVIAKTTKPR
jgi:hypothetical protein